LSLAIIQSLDKELRKASEDNRVRVIVIAAAGKLFSAGHDLKELASHSNDADKGKTFFVEAFRRCSALMQSIALFPKPVIAEVDGIAAAAGCQLVATCDLAVASERSRFAVNGIDVGLFCTTPAVALTRVVSRKRAMEMLLTGEIIDARTALEFGLVNRVVETPHLTERVNELALTIARKSPLAVELGKRAVNAQVGMELSAAYETASLAMVQNLMTSDAEEGIAAFLEHREVRW
jgi:enoyl-CoA hydratase/carnithine racemase